MHGSGILCIFHTRFGMSRLMSHSYGKLVVSPEGKSYTLPSGNCTTDYDWKEDGG